MPLGPPPIAVVMMSCVCAGRLTSNAVTRRAANIVKRRMYLFSSEFWVRGRVSSGQSRSLLFQWNHRAAADQGSLLPRIARAIPVEDDQVGLRRSCHPFVVFTLRNGELLIHFNELVALPSLHGLEASPYCHVGRRSDQRNHHAFCVLVRVIEESQVKSDLHRIVLLMNSADVEISGKLVTVGGCGHRDQQHGGEQTANLPCSRKALKLHRFPPWISYAPTPRHSHALVAIPSERQSTYFEILKTDAAGPEKTLPIVPGTADFDLRQNNFLLTLLSPIALSS